MEKIKKLLNDFLLHSKVVGGLLPMLLVTVSILVLMMPEESGYAGLKNPVVGQEAPQTVYAQCDFKIIDHERMKQLQRHAVDAVPLYYRRMDDSSSRISTQFQYFFEEIERRALAERQRNPYTETDAVAAKGASGAFQAVKNLSESDFRFFRRIQGEPETKKAVLQQIYDRILNEGILSRKEKDELPSGEQILIFDVVQEKMREFAPRPVSAILAEQEAGRKAAQLLIPQFSMENAEEREAFQQRIAPVFAGFFSGGNLRASAEKTEEQRKKAAENIKPVHRNLQNGDILIHKHTRITQADIQLLKEYRKTLEQQKGVKTSWRLRAGKVALCLIFLFFTILYLYHIHPEVLKNNRSIWLLGIIAILSLLANRLLAGGYRYISEQSGYSPLLLFLFLPLGLPSILISTIYGLRSGIYVGIFVSGITAVALQGSFPALVTGLFICAGAGYAVRHITDYKKFFMTSFFFTTAATWISGLVFLFGDKTDVDLYLLRDTALISASSGFITSLLALVIIFTLESFFDICTNMSFLTYTDRNHPLLKRLQLEAPGTYHHSERVASIGEKAADEIGANALKVQACALFHDIGKLADPGMFTENSVTENPHEHLTPLQSAELIRKHVTYGLELAKKYKLKTPIQDAIAQHHGTDFISFFYGLAKQQNPDNPPDPAQFQYPGPLPRSKEYVILGLADCAEAVARSLPVLTEEKLREKLKEIFIQKLTNGQFDESGITNQEIAKIRESFVTSLIAMSHVRIAYPKFQQEKNEK